MEFITDEENRISDLPYQRSLLHSGLVFLAGSIVNVAAGTSGATVVLQFVYACVPMWSLASWIRRNDRNTARANVLVPFYRAAGCVRATSEALMLTVVYIAIYAGAAQQAPPDRAMHAVIALLVGILLTTLTGLWAIVKGLIAKQAVWIDPHIAFRLLFLDKFSTRPGYNRVVSVIAISIAMPPLLAVGLGVTKLQGMVPKNQQGGNFGTWLMLGIFLTSFAVLYVIGKLAASVPEECWPEIDDEDGAVTAFRLEQTDEFGLRP